MKKSELEKLDEINEEKRMSKEVKDVILRKVFRNFMLAIDILLFFIILIGVSQNFNKELRELIYKISSVVLLLFTLFLFELAYKKSNGEICMYGIETFILSIITLLMPYIFLEKKNIYTSIVGAYFAVYYILKNLYIYKKEKNKYLSEINDIKQIVKKESQDNLVKEHNEKKEQKLKINKRNTARKPGRPKKEKAKKDKKITRTTEVKRPGRPRKNKIEEPEKNQTKKVGRPKKKVQTNRKEEVTTNNT